MSSNIIVKEITFNKIYNLFFGKYNIYISFIKENDNIVISYPYQIIKHFKYLYGEIESIYCEFQKIKFEDDDKIYCINKPDPNVEILKTKIPHKSKEFYIESQKIKFEDDDKIYCINKPDSNVEILKTGILKNNRLKFYLTEVQNNTTNTPTYTKGELSFMKMAIQMATLSKCCSKQVAAIIVKNNGIVSSGINGTYPSKCNCNEHAKKSGWLNDDNSLNQEFRSVHAAWSDINELHAEQAAIIRCAKNGISLDGCSIYINLSPCIHCAKSIAFSGIKEVFYNIQYDRGDSNWIEYLESHNIKVTKINMEN